MLRISMVEAVEDQGEAVETETSPLRFFFSFSEYYVTQMFVLLLHEYFGRLLQKCNRFFCFVEQIFLFTLVLCSFPLVPYCASGQF